MKAMREKRAQRMEQIKDDAKTRSRMTKQTDVSKALERMDALLQRSEQRVMVGKSNDKCGKQAILDSGNKKKHKYGKTISGRS